MIIFLTKLYSAFKQKPNIKLFNELDILRLNRPIVGIVLTLQQQHFNNCLSKYLKEEDEEEDGGKITENQREKKQQPVLC